ncbi:cyclin-dependent kinase inhibitor 3 family protein [Lyngbya sp. PCC 8106]|uniref:cyclin-dependent kinase inhibitor 3 family protein n=1 Tax=Lyngbya sp. (strain PCC 8106) TaxID=313612 RepID=UPI0000EAC373|nr:cyclin-dependent kinase inhibitor 3 family protein [Lyngbya sp. PCC 8106]EAW33983.1 protein phosphatase-like protein [Lyngbya sp. PCC 8106]
MNAERTSQNDPITVDFLPPNQILTLGQIGLTFAPGKKHQGMHFMWDRSLEQDLDRLRNNYQTDVLISLIESHEFEAVQIPDLIVQAQARKMQTIWFPIPDMSVPNSIDELILLVQKILLNTQQNKTVVIHCMGGLGRTGMVAACCLVALGYSPEKAIKTVREIRQYSIETQQQEDYISEFAYAWETPKFMMSRNLSRNFC